MKFEDQFRETLNNASKGQKKKDHQPEFKNKKGLKKFKAISLQSSPT